ncbi:helix-turn-helix domain-containing protein [Cupriavidus sp. AcVe19-6a]|uniref:helix-turn-helix domain-containing protein n=1 Tax=Cupriavidus sp. AcVe19-6a TaxID=2821358 RepID=UPI001AE31322|nr:helix-turn-helix transcriptional regulator [Cupriavidus sp. AcVe19-6a]MBP0635915.1 helix-turn-helix transcriptional regulator [Cupriavidus sp. AcVe19-6a]
MRKTDMDELAGVVGRAIARQRIAANLTQEQVAERLGIGNEAVSRIERGVVMPTIGRLAELADIFQCETSDLLTEASNRSADQANHLARLLAKVGGHDRAMIVEMVEKLAVRLARR